MSLALRLLRRDWRSGDLNILIFSIILAVATITAISLFTSRLKNAIGDEAAVFFAGDARIQSSIPLQSTWLKHLNDHRLSYSQSVAFRAMAFSESGMQLTAVKAVSDQYPLKGTLTISAEPFGKNITVANGPKPGEVWLASRLFSVLGIEVGDKIAIGEGNFVAAKALVREPDSTQSFFGVAPRALIHVNDVQKTGAVQTGSRVNYTLMIAGKTQAIKGFHEWVKPQLGAHANWSDARSGNRQISDTLNKAENFLLLAGSLSVVLTGVAIALSARRYAQRHLTQVALLKTMGQTPQQITRFYLAQILVIGLLTIAIGALLGGALQRGIIVALGDLLPTNISSPTPGAYFIGIVTGLISLFAFAAPPLLSLRKVPPVKVLQQTVDGGLISTKNSFIIGFSSISSLMYFFCRDITLTVILIIGLSSCLIGVAALSWLLIRLTHHFSKLLSPSWRLGVANLRRHSSYNIVQIMIFAILMMLMFILILIRTSLIDQWRDTVPPNAPNHFIFNIFNHELRAVKDLIANAGVKSQPLYPMVRGRVLSVNGVQIKTLLKNTDSRMNYRRELNLTWAKKLGSDNTVIAGDWQEKLNSKTLYVSAEQEYAKGLNLKIGDQITFSITGRQFNAELSSIRSVDWDSMNPNFFMIFNRPVLEGTATNWLTSIHIQPHQKHFINTLTKQFPTVSVIEIEQMITHARQIISQITKAIEFIMGLVLVAGTLVFITSIQATLDTRFHEGAILRSLGASKRLIRNQLLVEFCTLGALAAVLAIAGTEITLFLLQTMVFELAFTFHWQLWLFAIPLASAMVGMIGWLSSRTVVHISPLAVLRKI